MVSPNVQQIEPDIHSLTFASRYWSSQMSPSDPTRTYQYHRDSYGSKFLYDDFMANFTAEKFRPKEWVDLFADAGAQYFVLTTKHHDGYALFDMPETVSKRNSVKQVPHRDFLKVRRFEGPVSLPLGVWRKSERMLKEKHRRYSMQRRGTSHAYGEEHISACPSFSTLRTRIIPGWMPLE